MSAKILLAMPYAVDEFGPVGYSTNFKIPNALWSALNGE
jgi:hypothetical protein